MAAPDFEWSEYEVEVGRTSVVRRFAAGPVDAGTTTVTIPLPDLTRWAAPRAKAEILLQTAAEVEHALMVQYLYAAYSLKTVKDVTDQAQKAVLKETSATSWPQSLLGIAREEMGHLMTVQNLLLLLGLAPNFEREDFPPHKDLYPFALHLEPLTRRSLAKYVVAEAPVDAEGIDDAIELATESAGGTINHVGILYGLLGLVFTAEDDVEAGGSGSDEWDEIVRRLADAAYQQAPPSAWHLADADLNADARARQADPADWQVGHLRVHSVADRAAAVRAIRDIGEQGEGPTSEGEASHFDRFLGIFRGGGGVAPFPEPSAWTPTRAVPVDPNVGSIGEPRTKRWAELADIRYALLLGLLEHYLLASGDDRRLLVAWVVAEMRSRIAFIARELTAMPLGGGAGAGAVAAIPFTLPAELHLPADEPARWGVHRARTEAAIAKVEEMQAADTADGGNSFLADLLASDRARLGVLSDPAAPRTTSFARDIGPLFRPKDVQHMLFRGVDLRTHDRVREAAALILERLRDSEEDQMPPPPDQRWTPAQLELFERWIAEGFPQ
jgi:hypothetical protein